jgi:hypothetical protein
VAQCSEGTSGNVGSNETANDRSSSERPRGDRRSWWLGGTFAVLTGLWVAWGACWTSSGVRPPPDPGISVPPIGPVATLVSDPACSSGSAGQACLRIRYLANVVIGLLAEEYLAPIRVTVTPDRRVRYETRVLMTMPLDFAVRDFDSLFTSPIRMASIAPDSTVTFRHYSLVDDGRRYDVQLNFSEEKVPSSRTTVDVVMQLVDPFSEGPPAPTTTKR